MWWCDDDDDISSCVWVIMIISDTQYIRKQYSGMVMNEYVLFTIYYMDKDYDSCVRKISTR